jgi:hypothetical protein
MLAPSGVRYVVLLTSLAPEITGEQTPQEYPVPADLAPGLARQLDLTPVVSGTGITVYANAAWIPERAQVGAARTPATSRGASSAATALARTSPTSPIVPGARPVLPGPAASSSYRGPLSTGTVLSALAPAGRWNLVEPDGSTAARSASFGWAGKYQVTEAGIGRLGFDGGVLAPLSLVGSIIVWLVALAVVLGRRLGRSWGRVRTGRRRPRRAAVGSADASAATVPADPGIRSEDGMAP